VGGKVVSAYWFYANLKRKAHQIGCPTANVLSSRKIGLKRISENAFFDIMNRQIRLPFLF
jgi:hypothetical protein